MPLPVWVGWGSMVTPPAHGAHRQHGGGKRTLTAQDARAGRPKCFWWRRHLTMPPPSSTVPVLGGVAPHGRTTSTGSKSTTRGEKHKRITQNPSKGCSECFSWGRDPRIPSPSRPAPELVTSLSYTSSRGGWETRRQKPQKGNSEPLSGAF